MYKALLSTFVIFSTTAYSQIAIGKQSTSNSSVSLEFYDGNDNKLGLTLPWINSQNSITSPSNGTFIFETSTKKVKFFQAGNWIDLSLDETGTVDLTLQNNLIEQETARVFIGKEPENDTTKGVLVLGDDDKAMILPRVAHPHLNIINPEAGTIAFDTVTKQLAIFNGNVWTFWKP